MVPIIIFVLPFLVMSFLSFLYRKLFQTEVELKDKIILVTGASSGLGEACAKRYAKSGCKLVLCARNVQELTRVKNEIVGNETSQEWPLVFSMDVTRADDVLKVVRDVEEKYAPIDIVVSNAGMSNRGAVSETVLDVHRRLMEVNYFGQVNLIKAVLPSMRKRGSGHIITIGSVQGKIAIPFRAAYSASKHAAQAFVDSLRAEVANESINVTMVNPGYIRTNLSKNAVSGDGSKHGVMDSTTASGMSPSFVANVICDATIFPTNEVFLADVKSNIAMYIRTLSPSLYFKIMEWRAKIEWKKYKKTS